MLKCASKLFPEQMKRRALHKCPVCGKEVNPSDFRDDLSKSEFEISGLCQRCQDKFFSEDYWEELEAKMN